MKTGPCPVCAPQTLDGIKRLAKRIKKAEGIPHHEAIDRAARQAGHNNFYAARKVLASP